MSMTHVSHLAFYTYLRGCVYYSVWFIHSLVILWVFFTVTTLFYPMSCDYLFCVVVTCTVNNVYCVLSEFSFYKVSIINSKNVFFCSGLICELTIMVWKNTLPYHKVLWIWKKVVNRIKFSTYQKFVTPWLPAINKFDYKINI